MISRRQVETHPISTVTPDVIVNGFSTMTPTPGSSTVPVTLFQHSGTSVSVSVVTVTVSQPPADSAPVPSSPLISSSKNTSAIVGGVIGASALIVAAAIASFYFLHRRKSTRRGGWTRSRGLSEVGGMGRWYDLDSKAAIAPGHGMRSFDGNEYRPDDVRQDNTAASRSFLTSSVTPAFIRDKQSSSRTSDPFADPHTAVSSVPFNHPRFMTDGDIEMTIQSSPRTG